MKDHAYLRLRFNDDDDGTGSLFARAEARRFSGETRAYFDKRELETFAAQLRTFPLRERVSICGGYGKHVLLEIACYPIDERGHLGVQVRMATEESRNMRPEAQLSASVELLTTYGDVERFSHAIESLLHGNSDDAVLVGE